MNQEFINFSLKAEQRGKNECLEADLGEQKSEFSITLKVFNFGWMDEASTLEKKQVSWGWGTQKHYSSRHPYDNPAW